MQVIAAGIKEGENGYRFGDINPEVRNMIRIEVVEDVPFVCFSDDDGSLRARYADKVDYLDSYEPGEDIQKTREMAFLDECRDKYCIDDVKVYLLKDGLKPEGCWTRITGLGDHFFVGDLLNEPDQDFGYHLGERIGFWLQSTEDGHTICVSDMNPSRALTEADLEDGTVLRDAIKTFNNERNQDNFIEVLELLRDSYVWIPCTVTMSDRDMEAFTRMVESKENLEDIIGEEFNNSDALRMIPDILQNGDNYFFPAFSSVEEMGEYGNDFSPVQEHFLTVIKLAMNNDKDLSGIVVNAFTEPFVLEKEIFDMVDNLKSRLIDQN